MESGYSIGVPSISLPPKSRSAESVFGGVEARRGGLTLLPLVKDRPLLLLEVYSQAGVGIFLASRKERLVPCKGLFFSSPGW